MQKNSTKRFWSILLMLVVVVSTAMTLSSCSNDENDDSSMLIGRWYLPSSVEDDDDAGIEFRKDGSTYNYNWWGTGKGSYVYNSGNSTLMIRSPHRTETYFNVNVSKNSLSFIDNLKSATIIQYTIKGRFMSR